jgi:hypothetical protein
MLVKHKLDQLQQWQHDLQLLLKQLHNLYQHHHNQEQEIVFRQLKKKLNILETHQVIRKVWDNKSNW